MEKINLKVEKPSTITPQESPGISLGTCVTPGQTCGWYSWGALCGWGCNGGILCA